MNNKKSTVQLVIRANVAYLTLARPDASNTIDLQLARELLKSVVEIEVAGARAGIRRIRARRRSLHHRRCTARPRRV